MPEFFPDLKSVRLLAEDMSEQRNDEQKYTGIVPTTEEELLEARTQLAAYMRNVWNDEIAAMEIELAITPDNYEEKMEQVIMKKVRGIGGF